MDTVYSWIPEILQANSITYPQMLPNIDQRLSVICPSIDAIFILGKGFLYFDNMPIGFMNDDLRKKYPDAKWIYIDTPNGNILLLFMFLTQAASGVSGSWWDPIPYLSSFQIANPHLGS